MSISFLKQKWNDFKNERRMRPNMKQDNPYFITVRQRERLINKLFKEIERLSNEKQVEIYH